MEKRKYKAYHHLPVGTVIVDRNSMFSHRIITKHVDGGYIWSYENRNGKMYDFEKFQRFILDFAEEIIIPHGFQSPLWKVLNGEEV